MIGSDFINQLDVFYTKREEALLYHGSVNIIKKPLYNEGEVANDYGLGFYLTENFDLAGEWAVLYNNVQCYINSYSLSDDLYDILYTKKKSDLTLLNLHKEKAEVWISILLKHRHYDLDDIDALDNTDAFIDKYYIDPNNYDVVIGWRADDYFFKYIVDFASSRLSIENLKDVVKYGGLGNQVCLKSEVAFNSIKYHVHKMAKKEKFFQKAKNKDGKAKSDYKNLRNKKQGNLIEDLI